MKFRRNNFDVTNVVDVTDPFSVGGAVESIFLNLYPNGHTHILWQAINDIARLYHGENPVYAACDTGYHDLQHIMDVTLACARLMDGYERAQRQKNSELLGEELFLFGILLALFHDSGYLRKRGHEENRHGAEFTLMHVTRSAEILRVYLHGIGMESLSETSAQVVHYTGYEIPIDNIVVPSPIFRAIGNLVASADILAQMSDRCYLEKCYDRLYTEFVLGGIANKIDEDGNEQVVFASPRDLVIKTPNFYRGARKRLDEALKGAHQYAEKHFGGQNLYLEAVERNIQFAEYVVANHADIGMLQRNPPKTPGSDHASIDSSDRKQQVEDRRKRNADRRQNQEALYPDFADQRKHSGDRRRITPSKK